MEVKCKLEFSFPPFRVPSTSTTESIDNRAQRRRQKDQEEELTEVHVGSSNAEMQGRSQDAGKKDDGDPTTEAGRGMLCI
jgi:hypothetical protein